jgi:hypothetical protein
LAIRPSKSTFQGKKIGRCFTDRTLICYSQKWRYPLELMLVRRPAAIQTQKRLAATPVSMRIEFAIEVFVAASRA